MQSIDRIQCYVPFCKRTAKREDPDGQSEIICGLHAKPVSKRIKKLHRACKLKIEKIQDKWPDPKQAPPEIVKRIMVLVDCEAWIWNRFKREVIEIAGGIR